MKESILALITAEIEHRKANSIKPLHMTQAKFRLAIKDEINDALKELKEEGKITWSSNAHGIVFELK
jgi:hypothetical protein